MDTISPAETAQVGAATDLTEWSINLDAPDPIVAEGRYAAVIERPNTRYSQAGNPMLTLTYRIADEGEFYNWPIRQNFMLTGDQTWRLKNLLKSLGWKGIFDVARDYAALEGLPVFIDVTHGPGFPDPTQPQAQVKYVVGRDPNPAQDIPF